MNTINNSIGQDPNSKSLIGVLDIYGFESFKTNRCLTGMPFCILIDGSLRELVQVLLMPLKTSPASGLEAIESVLCRSGC